MKRLQLVSAVIAMGFLSVLFFNCGGLKKDHSEYSFTQNPPFSIEEIYSQKWMSGVKGGGHGEVLMVTFSDFQKGVTIKKAYFKKKEAEFVKGQNKDFSYAAGFVSNINKDIIMDSNPENEAKNIPPQKFPFQLKEDEAVLSYSYTGVEYYFKVSNIEEKEVIAYPSGNPNNEN